MNKIRCFIAIELPVTAKKVLSHIQYRLQQYELPRIKWVTVPNIHLTLKFLGNVAPETVVSITKTIDDLSRKMNPFNLQLGNLGAFPNLKSPQVLWIGLKGEVTKLITLQQSLDGELAKLGFSEETRAYQPHLTLARFGNKVTRTERQRVGDLVSGIVLENNFDIKVDTIYFIKSQLTPNGPIYDQLHTARFT
jgi:2'-5' RNA ligase